MVDMIDKPFVAVQADPQICPGCPFELKPNVPGLWELGEQIAKEMDQLNKSDFKYKVLQIVKVFRSVPPNMNVVRNSFCILTFNFISFFLNYYYVFLFVFFMMMKYLFFFSGSI